jgi:hypothetical protein
MSWNSKRWHGASDMLDPSSIKPGMDFAYAVLPFANYRECENFLEAVGPTVSKAKIEVRQGQLALLHSPNEMSLHTDHPQVEMIAWYCVQPSDDGGESLLLDFNDIKALLAPEHLDELSNVKVAVPAVRSLGPRSVSPLLSPRGLYYAEWLVQRDTIGAPCAALTAFREAIAALPWIHIRLDAGQMLIINNKRMMHGRKKIIEKERRRLLIRHWITHR